MQRYSWWVRPVSGGTFFCEIQKPFPRTVRNKEELSLRATMDLVGPSRQALHVQSSSDDSRLLTTPCRVQRGGGRRRGPRLERPGDGEDTAVESQTERSGKLDWFGCGVGLHSAENNRRCGVERWPSRRRGSVSLRGAQNNTTGRRRLEQVVPAALGEEDERLKKNAGRWM